MIINQKNKWIIQYPKFGGLPLGFEKIFGKPEFIISNGKDDNDQHYILNRPDIPVIIQENFEKKDVNINFIPDIFVALPGCAGLQTVGNNFDEKIQLDYDKNKEIINLVNLGIDLGQKVICIEQSDGMYSQMGENIVNALKQISFNNNYQMHIYKSNCLLHGIPQNRIRCFVIFYKGDKIPVFNWEQKETPSVSEYLDKIPEDSLYYNEYYRDLDIQIIKNLYEYFGTEDINEIIEEVYPGKKLNYISCLKIIRKIGISNFLSNENVKVNDYIKKRLLFAMDKINNNSGVWDWSPVILVNDNHVKPVIFRNYQTIHPKKNRILNIRELIWLFGIPHQYKMANVREKYKHISRNVPVPVQEFIASQIDLYLKNELPIKSAMFLKQDNIKKYIDQIERNQDNFLKQLGI